MRTAWTGGVPTAEPGLSAPGVASGDADLQGRWVRAAMTVRARPRTRTVATVGRFPAVFSLSRVVVSEALLAAHSNRRAPDEPWGRGNASVVAVVVASPTGTRTSRRSWMRALTDA